MKLRPYQRECVDAIWRHVQASPEPAVAVLPTGAGKGVILAQLAKDVVAWKGRMVVLAHVKELLVQTFDNIERLAPQVHAGVYSAGLGSRELAAAVTVAGIQSIYKRAEDLGAVDVIAIDEAHRIPPEGEGQYRTFLEGMRALNPNVRLVGLTATPYRTGTGLIYGKDQLFAKPCFEIGVRQLIMEGFLSPLKSKAGNEQADVSGVEVRGGEFVQSSLQAVLMADEMKVAGACVDIGAKTQDRRSVIVFAAGVEHAQMIARFLRELEVGQVREVYGDTPADERAQTIADFRAGRVKYLVNVEVLTTGFDAPGVDAVVMMRPTMSAGLHYQMIGRGLRLAEGKTDCRILDFSGNLLRHGPIDRLLIGPNGPPQGGAGGGLWKKCPSCEEVMPRSCGVCPDCGAKIEREDRGVGHGAAAGDRAPLSEPEPVQSIYYSYHVKKDAPEGHPPTLRVTYDCGLLQQPSEWVCIEHTGFARSKAEAWWRARSDQPVPKTVAEALEVIARHGIKEPKRIALQADGKYLRVAKHLDFTFKAPGATVA
jgi:DNA repair protein RadD